MHATRRARPPALLRLLLITLLAAASFVPQLVGTSTSSSADAAVPALVGARAVSLAATRHNAVYRRGAQGPNAFDCSGLTRWTYGRLGKRLPRTAQQQWAATLHVRATSRRPGDLVFFFSGRHVYHVAIYAGNNQIWHAAKPGTRIKRVPLWTSKVRYGRVR